MKKYLYTAMALVLAASLFTGCGCTNRNVSDHPNGLITDPTTMTTNPMPTMTTPPENTTIPHRETTAPTHAATEPMTTDATIETGTGDTGATDDTGMMPSDGARGRAHSNGR